MSHQYTTSRRAALKTAMAATAFTILPRRLLGGPGQTPPSEEFRFVQVGCGGKGESDLNNTVGSGGRLVAMCDVDQGRAQKSRTRFPDLPIYADYRELLDKHDKEIDGVVVSTPDHTHAVVALDAIRRGKHVYVQKPLARTWQECQILQDAARKHGVVTQMGNQGHAGSGLKLWKEMQEKGAFGDVAEASCWSDRPIWPQGMTEPPKAEQPPAGLSWNEWVGPVADRPYSGEYVPFKWRGWWDFGCGAMGDMACHNMDPVFWMYKLGLPTTVKAEASAPAGIAYPAWSIIEYTFEKSPVTGKPFKLTWLDGKKMPKLPENAHPDLKAGGNGCLVVGSKLSAMGGSHAGRPTVISLGTEEYGPAVKEAEKFWREEGKKHEDDNHHRQWVDAAKAGNINGTGSQFDYSVPFTQSILLGCVALRFPGQELKWDSKARQFSNHAEANQWLSFQARPGYDLTTI